MLHRFRYFIAVVTAFLALGGKLPVTLVANAAEAADALLARLAPGDAVLVKASNGIGLASLVERVAGGRA